MIEPVLGMHRSVVNGTILAVPLRVMVPVPARWVGMVVHPVVGMDRRVRDRVHLMVLRLIGLADRPGREKHDG